MAEWLVERGVAEVRAGLVERGRLLEMQVERDDGALRVGTVADVRLTRRADATGRGLVTFADGATALLQPVPTALTEGATLRVEVVREALPEAGGLKPPRVRPAPDMLAGPAPDLPSRLAATGHPVRHLAGGDDALDHYGWVEAIEEAASGLIPRADAMLRISPTPR